MRGVSTVKSLDSAARHDGSSSAFAALAELLQQVLAIADGELRKLRRDPTEVLTRSVQPIPWLLVFGQVFGRSRAIPTGALSYLDFMAPGVLAQSVLFTAIFYGIAIIWERDLGIIHKMLVSPAYRSALVFGKAASAGVRGLTQTIIIYGVTFLLGIHIRLEVLPVLGVLMAVLLGSAVFSTFSLVIACVVKTRERFMGRGSHGTQVEVIVVVVAQPGAGRLEGLVSGPRRCHLGRVGRARALSGAWAAPGGVISPDRTS